MFILDSSAKLVLGDLNKLGLDQVVSEIKKRGGNAIASKCDVTSWDEQTKLFELAVATFGSVDIVVSVFMTSYTFYVNTPLHRLRTQE